MRLIQIKLAGFKSFVDPTTIATPGQLVGIVGPNGCGKSNVIDAVRWVLGESKASALRGESMQDVIFNGAGDRKPIGRASVELHFDNSLGRAAGQWSQYGELSIRRVLQRDGDSSFYINNVAVRRRDITDLFLGTGLGPRAYAIIEQGMISRIIEAKPEEVRIFLEEAAGVSKYKERRKETESRLSDTRDNLARIEDIRSELATQLTRLESQAKVAVEYRDLERRLGQAQRLLWFAKQQEAARNRERWSAELARLQTSLEGLQAQLRETEAKLEAYRADHFEASDELHAAQGEFYAANAAVAGCEQQLQFQRESEERLGNQLAHLENQIADVAGKTLDAVADIASGNQALELALTLREAASADERQAGSALPALEQQLRDIGERVAELQRLVGENKQALHIAAGDRAHAEKLRGQLAARRARLKEELSVLPSARAEQIASVQDQWQQEISELIAREEAVTTAQAEAAGLQTVFEAQRADEQRCSRELAAQEARATALAGLQSRLRQNEDSGDWMHLHSMSDARRLWQCIDIAKGWEDALEGVLREGLNAIRVDDLDQICRLGAPPSRLAVFQEGRATVWLPTEPSIDAEPLLSKIAVRDSSAQNVIADGLAGVYCVADLACALALSHGLRPGERCVTPEGHVVSLHEIRFFAPDQSIHGVLVRQRELDELERGLGGLRESAASAERQRGHTEELLKRKQSEYRSQTAAASSQQRRCHDLELELMQLQQAADVAEKRAEQISREIEEVSREDSHESEQQRVAQAKAEVLQREQSELATQLAAAKQALSAAELAVENARNGWRSAERLAQEAAFSERSRRERLAELSRRHQSLQQQAEQLRAQHHELAGQRENTRIAEMEVRLQELLERRLEKERALAAARDRLEMATSALQEAEATRFKVEQQLEPARLKIGEVQLKEQAARLQEDQFTEQLQNSAGDLVGLPEQLQAWGKATALPGEIERLRAAIVALGAVNIAALEELEAATQRKDYLDRQAADLNEAITTLENAIRRIDRETRSLLQDTFDAVNRHFGELFPRLFGGGEARLVLTGDEILDAGIQVVAQPPGKRNSSIHLLSGGEKALTALSLVFALFQLNPAPFCLLDEVDAPLDDTNTERFCELVKSMASSRALGGTQFLYISHNKISMEMANQLVGVTMAEPGVSRVVAVDIAEALQLAEQAAA